MKVIYIFFRTFSFLFVFSLASLSGFAQTYRYAFNIGGNFSESARDIVQDANYNVYVVGSIGGSSTVDFDPGPGIANVGVATAITYIAKYDSAGSFVWVSPIHVHSFYQEAQTIAYDPQGYIYIGGFYSDSIDFDPTAGVSKGVSRGGQEAYIAKYDTGNGNLIWARSIGGANDDRVNSIAVDGSGNVIATGYFTDDLYLDQPTPSETGTKKEIFVVKYDASGNLLWSKSMGGPEDDEGNDVKTGSGSNIFVGGSFSATADFDPTTSTDNRTSKGKKDMFVSVFDGTGNYGGTSDRGGPSDDVVWSMAFDQSNNLLIAGEFRDSVDFDPGPGVVKLYGSPSPIPGYPAFSEIFIAKYDITGAYKWAKAYGSNFNDRAFRIASSGNMIFFAGELGGGGSPIDFGGGIQVTPGANVDGFIAAADTNGIVEWAFSVGGTFANYIKGISVERNSDIYVAGTFNGTTDFNPASAVANLTSAGGTDFFLGKYNYCTTTSSSTSASFCKGGSFQWEGQSLSAPGHYEEIYSNAAGCDSIVALELTIDSVEDYNVNRNFATLSVNLSSAATYQWIDCDNGSAISGATSSTFTATINGSYAVIVGQNGCSDTSACVTIDSIGVGIATIPEAAFGDVFPNPTAGEVSIELRNKTRILIINALGKTAWSKYLSAGRHALDLTHLPEGIYFIKDEKSTAVMKLVIVR